VTDSCKLIDDEQHAMFLRLMMSARTMVSSLCKALTCRRFPASVNADEERDASPSLGIDRRFPLFIYLSKWPATHCSQSRHPCYERPKIEFGLAPVKNRWLTTSRIMDVEVRIVWGKLADFSIPEK
jgi:hypothetical protein